MTIQWNNKNIKQIWARNVKSGFLIFQSMLLIGICGCTTAGVRTDMKAPKAAALPESKSLGVKVIVNDEFTVAVNQVNEVSTPVIVEGRIVRQAGKVVKDSIRTEEFRPLLDKLDIKSVLNSRLIDGLQSSGRFTSLYDLSSRPQSPPGDGMLIIKVKYWGLMSAIMKDTPPLGQVALEADASFFRGSSSIPVWERSDYVAGDTLSTLESYNSPGFLRSAIDKLLSKYSDRVINEINSSYQK